MTRDEARALALRFASDRLVNPETWHISHDNPETWTAADWILDAIQTAANAIPQSAHALVQLIEQSARTITRACESVKYGADDVQPDQPLSNRQRLTNEVTGLRSAAIRCIKFGQLHEWQIRDIALMAAKDEKVNRYLQYSVSLAMVLPTGPLDEQERRDQADSQAE